MKLKSNKPITNYTNNDIDRSAPKQVAVDQPADHFTIRDGIEFAGSHLIVDLWGAEPLDDLVLMESTLRKAVEVAGATLLHIHLHHFTPNDGLSLN